MKPAKSRGHELAHRWLLAFLTTLAVLVALAPVYGALGQPGWLLAAGGVLVFGAAVFAVITGGLYAAMFLVWLTRKRVG